MSKEWCPKIKSLKSSLQHCTSSDTNVASSFRLKSVTDTAKLADPGRAVRERPLPGFYIYYWMYSYAQFVDMLRNEKPVFFVFEDFEGWATLVTDLDAVGEARHA
jgi:hypothetical protein